jgi:hypothetical protein
VSAWIGDYRALELEVQTAMRELCRPSCARCRRRCCKEVFCREALDSPFLALVRAEVGTAPYDPKRGWLGPTGCRLEVGRPPICYEYVCPEILYTLHGDGQCFAANLLGEVMAFVGRSAVGAAHAVELDADALRHLDGRALRRRVARGRAGLAACRRALAGVEVDRGDHEAMARIAGEDPRRSS